MQRWVALVLTPAFLPAVLLAGCSEPDDRFPPWRPSSAPGGPQAIANGTFQFVDVSGTVREEGAEPSHADCMMEPASADVDVERRRLVLDQATMSAWNYAATLIVRDTVHEYGEGSSCNVPVLLWPQPELRYRGEGSTMGLAMDLSSLTTGPAIGGSFRVLEEGVPYRHRVHWQEVDPFTGEEREFTLDATFLYRGLWTWADSEVGQGTTHWT